MATALSSRNICYSFLVPKHNLRKKEVMVKFDWQPGSLSFKNNFLTIEEVSQLIESLSSIPRTA